VPDNVPPDPNVPVGCIFNSINCNLDAGVRRITTMAVKPSAAP
jgi:hypothetical protein